MFTISKNKTITLSPSLWENGKFPSFEQYMALMRRGRLFYVLDQDGVMPAVGPSIVERPCNLLYHTAMTNYMVPPKQGGWKGIARNELLIGSLSYEKQYSSSLHAVGIPVIIYQNDNNFDSLQFSKDEISAISAELDPFVWAFSNPGRQFACTNKPAWRKLLAERLKIRVGDAGADGVFLDNNTPFIHCRCSVCQELYKQATGRDLIKDMGNPDTVVADMRVFDYVGPSQLPKDLVPVDSPVIMRYLEWRVERAVDFYKDLRIQIEKAIGRQIIYTANGHIGIAEQSGVMISGVFDMNFSEDGFSAPPVSNGFNLRLGSAITEGKGCPFIITRVTESAPVADMIKVLNAEARALGGQADFWDIHYRQDSKLAEAARQIRMFHIEQAEKLYAVEEDSNDIAILYSCRSDLWTSAADSPAKMASGMLEDINQPYDVLIAERYGHCKKLPKYKLLIVPHVEILPDVWFDSIEKFMDTGGHVISTGNTAKFNENLTLRTKRWSSSRWQHFDERVEKEYARSRRMIGIHSGFVRPSVAFAKAIDNALAKPSVKLEKAQPLLTINHTQLNDGEAIHLVNRYCNVFPLIHITPRKDLVLEIMPKKPVKKITWISLGHDEFELNAEQNGDYVRISVPTLIITGIVRIYN